MPVYHTAAGTVEMLEWGDGPELFVLLHAAAAGPHSLSALATMLLRPGRRVIAPALDRYGATVMHEGTDRVQAHLAVLRACLTIHSAERRVLFGHSMGGLIALLGAMDGMSIDAMVLYEPIIIACLHVDLPEDVALRNWDRRIVAEIARGVAAGDPEGGIAAFVTAWNEVPWSALPSVVRARLLASAEQLAADTQAVSYHDLPMNRLSLIKAPVVILQGRLSPPITHAMSARLAPSLPNGQRRTIADCGHMGPVQMPAAIYQAIRSHTGLR